jgi:hypothetical protein
MSEVERADAASIPDVDQSFDLVVSILVWRHVELAEGPRRGCTGSEPWGWLLSIDLPNPFPSAPLRRLRLAWNLWVR